MISKQTAKAVARFDRDRLIGRSKKISNRTIDLLDAICTVDEVLDEFEGIDYNDNIDEDGEISA